MGQGHGHGLVAPNLALTRWSRAAVIAFVVVSGVVALLGVLQQWPDGQRVDRLRGEFPSTAPGVSIVHARLLSVRTACTGSETTTTATTCGHSEARVLDGRDRGSDVAIDLTPDVVASGLRAGDAVLLLRSGGSTPSSGASSSPADAAVGASAFSFYRADRGSGLVWLAVLFAGGVVLVAWRRGLMAVLSLGFAAALVVVFLLPALLVGRPAVPVTLAASVLILIVMLYLTHGFSIRTSVALAGALIGVVLSTAFAWFGVIGSRLAGIGNDAAGLLTFNLPGVHVQQLVVASVVLAGLGTLNDVTVTQASALWELRAAAPTAPRRALFRGAMRIGRDHVASTVYTLVFAYLGTSLVLLVAVQLTAGSPGDLLTSEDVAEEVVRTLVGGLAVVLAMPVTTAIGALLLTAAGAEGPAPADRSMRGAQPQPQYRRRSAHPVDD